MAEIILMPNERCFFAMVQVIPLNYCIYSGHGFDITSVLYSLVTVFTRHGQAWRGFQMCIL